MSAGSASSAFPPPLAGVTVVSFEQAVAAPFATRQLADLGARVIKIERPGDGDFARKYDTTVRGLSSHFVWLNRSKESLTLDLKHPDAREIIGRLAARADVVMQNLAPGAATRLGLSASALRAAHPRLIVCDISGYGSTGPYKEKKAYDLLVQNEAGLVSITGTEAAPSKVAISIADIAAGMYGYSAVLTALLVRERTGEGASIAVSLFDALGEWMGFPMYFALYGGSPPPRTGASHATLAPYGPYDTSDGTVVFGLQNEREWARFCTDVLRDASLVADPRFAGNSARVAHRVELDATLGSVLSALTTEETLARLDAAQIANSRMNSVHEFAAHPQQAARNRWHEIGSPAGPLRALAPPAIIEGVEPVMGAIPALGEHTEAILAELGYDVATIAEWRAKGAI
jgi:itaconate CoA-transferase